MENNYHYEDKLHEKKYWLHWLDAVTRNLTLHWIQWKSSLVLSVPIPIEFSYSIFNHYRLAHGDGSMRVPCVISSACNHKWARNEHSACQLSSRVKCFIFWFRWKSIPRRETAAVVIFLPTHHHHHPDDEMWKRPSQPSSRRHSESKWPSVIPDEPHHSTPSVVIRMNSTWETSS